MTFNSIEYTYVFEKTATVGENTMKVRLYGKVFREQVTISKNDGHLGVHDFNPLLIIPPNADARLRSLASAADKAVGGGIQGYLAIAS